MSLEIALTHQFPGFRIDAQFEAPLGVTALFGRSGAGKTTLVNAVSGLLRPDKALIRINGDTLVDTANRIDVPTHKRRIGYVFQDARLFPHLTVVQNLRFGGWFNPNRSAQPTGTLEHVVELLGIAHLLNRRPGMLSGGEKQRVAIGRALLSQPAFCSWMNRSRPSMKPEKLRSCRISSACAMNWTYPFSMSAMPCRK